MHPRPWVPYAELMDELVGALGVVPVEGRGSMPFALVHGESLVAAASWALTTAGVELFDYGAELPDLQQADRALVIHDPQCPLTPAAFLEQAVEESARTGTVVVGVRPVTDTVKEYAEAPDGGPGELGATVDRDELMVVTSPVVLPASVVAALEELPTDDLAALVASLVQRFPVRYLPAPPLGRRIVDDSDLEVLGALSSATG